MYAVSVCLPVSVCLCVFVCLPLALSLFFSRSLSLFIISLRSSFSLARGRDCLTSRQLGRRHLRPNRRRRHRLFGIFVVVIAISLVTIHHPPSQSADPPGHPLFSRKCHTNFRIAPRLSLSFVQCSTYVNSSQRMSVSFIFTYLNTRAVLLFRSVSVFYLSRSF